MSQPTVIQGPAYIVRGAHYVYTEGDVHLKYVREKWNPKGAITGKLGERHKSLKIVVSCKPVGEIETLTSNPGYWPYTPAMIGTDILSATPLSIIPLSGNKNTFPKSGLTKMPSLDLAPTRTGWGDIEWTCVGDPTVAQTNAAYFQTLAAVGAADTHFDETKVISPRYTAAWGASPFDVIQAQDGFQIDPVMELKEIYSVNYGLIAIILDSLGLLAKCIPDNLTEANLETLLKLQGASAVLPGDTYSQTGDDRDFVITGTGLTATLKHMGVGDGGMTYGAGTIRQGEFVWHNRRTWTAGVADALWTLA